MVVDVLGVDRCRDVVVFLLECGERSNYLGFLVGQQVCFLWGKFDLVSVFFRHFPFVLEGDSRSVLHHDLLFRGHSSVDWWEEQFVIIAQLQRWFVAVSHQTHLLDIGWVVVVNALGDEVIVTSTLGVELKAHQAKSFALDQAHWRVGFESATRILENFVVDRSIAGVRNLNGLVHRFVRAAGGEDHVVGGINFDHGNEGLRSWREGVAHQANTVANWRVYLLNHRVFELGPLHAPQQGLSFGHGLGLRRLRSSCSLLLLRNNPLVFAESSVVHLDEALSYLEEVLVWQLGSEFNLESKLRISFDLLVGWADFEWILDPLATRLIEDA